MPVKSGLLTRLWDLLLIVGIAAMVYQLSAMEPEVADPVFEVAPSAAVRLASTERAIVMTDTRPSADDCHCAADSRPRAAPAKATAPRQAPAERFSGEGGGRHQLSTTSDPHDSRAFIIETASNLHRRGWLAPMS